MKQSETEGRCPSILASCHDLSDFQSLCSLFSCHNWKKGTLQLFPHLFPSRSHQSDSATHIHRISTQIQGTYSDCKAKSGVPMCSAACSANMHCHSCSDWHGCRFWSLSSHSMVQFHLLKPTIKLQLLMVHATHFWLWLWFITGFTTYITWGTGGCAWPGCAAMHFWSTPAVAFWIQKVLRLSTDHPYPY